MPLESFARTTDPPVRGFLHTPATPNGRALILTHGAGSNSRAPLLIALAETFSSAGYIVLRCDLPYRQLRSWGPPGPADAARDRAGLKNAVLAIQEVVAAPSLADADPSVATDPSSPWKSGPLGPRQGMQKKSGASAPVVAPSNASEIFLGGHSYGGRQSSMLCAELGKSSNTEEKNLVAGLLLLSYPLHPPRKPDQQRTQHLPDLHTPALFVSGTRDPFGSIAELTHALKMIPARTKLVAIEGAGHDLGFKGKSESSSLPGQILADFQSFYLEEK